MLNKNRELKLEIVEKIGWNIYKKIIEELEISFKTNSENIDNYVFENLYSQKINILEETLKLLYKNAINKYKSENTKDYDPLIYRIMIKNKRRIQQDRTFVGKHLINYIMTLEYIEKVIKQIIYIVIIKVKNNKRD